MKTSMYVEYIIILNHCDWIKIEESIDTLPTSLKRRKNDVFRAELNFLEFMRALQGAREYEIIENGNFNSCRVDYHFESL